MNIRLEVVHSIRGRARIRVRSEHNPSVFFVILEATLHEIAEVRKAELNPYARSITLHYTRGADLDVLLGKWKDLLQAVMNDPSFPEQLERIEESLTYANGGDLQVSVRNRILTLTGSVDNAVKRITGNTLDLRTALPLGAFTAGVATLALAPGLPTPTWLVLMIFGFTSFNAPKQNGSGFLAAGPAEASSDRSRLLLADAATQAEPIAESRT